MKDEWPQTVLKAGSWRTEAGRGQRSVISSGGYMVGVSGQIGQIGQRRGYFGGSMGGGSGQSGQIGQRRGSATGRQGRSSQATRAQFIARSES